MIAGIHISRAVYVVAELGIADLLAGGALTAAQLAEATETEESSLYRVLRLLAALGLFTQENRSFGLTTLGERLRTGVPASMRSWATLIGWLGGAGVFGPIVESLKTGKPSMDIACGMGFFEFIAQHPDLERGFQAAMSDRTAAYAPSMATGYDFSGVRSVADIGGGKGTLLAAILAANGHLRGILFEQPAVAAAAHGVLADAGVADRCEIVPGDFFTAVPEGADVYLLANVLHDWDDPRSVSILAGCRRAMAAGGRVLIVERLIPDDPAEAVPVLLSDINMLVLAYGGLERTNPEYARLLEEAGLRLGRVQPIAPPYGVIEGAAPA
jgi:SAM-dependent methyltransferase